MRSYVTSRGASLLAALVASAAGPLLFSPGALQAAEPAVSRQVGAEVAGAGSGQSMTAGLVKKVDRDARKVTISHEPIEHLGMPKMSMVFRVKDPAMLDRLKPGDKIRFVAEKVDGAFTVMSFEPAN